MRRPAGAGGRLRRTRAAAATSRSPGAARVVGGRLSLATRPRRAVRCGRGVRRVLATRFRRGVRCHMELRRSAGPVRASWECGSARSARSARRSGWPWQFGPATKVGASGKFSSARSVSSARRSRGPGRSGPSGPSGSSGAGRPSRPRRRRGAGSGCLPERAAGPVAPGRLARADRAPRRRPGHGGAVRGGLVISAPARAPSPSRLRGRGRAGTGAAGPPGGTDRPPPPRQATRRLRDRLGPATDGRRSPRPGAGARGRLRGPGARPGRPDRDRLDRLRPHAVQADAARDPRREDRRRCGLRCGPWI